MCLPCPDLCAVQLPAFRCRVLQSQSVDSDGVEPQLFKLAPNHYLFKDVSLIYGPFLSQPWTNMPVGSIPEGRFHEPNYPPLTLSLDS